MTSILFSLFCISSFAQPVETKRYQSLLSELRCVVCQNQDLLDSHAPLAQDLKDKVYKLMQNGQSDEAIKAYLVERFGEFILFKPEMTTNTWVLWFAPWIILFAFIIGLVYWVRYTRVDV